MGMNKTDDEVHGFQSHRLELSDKEDQLATAIMLAILYIVFAFTFCGTAVSVVVFLRMRMNDVMTLCLFTISLVDFIALYIACGSCIPNVILRSPWAEYVSKLVYLEHIRYYLINLITIFQSISIAMVMLTSVERSLCVVAPLRVKTIVTLPRTKIAIAVIFALGFIANSPFLFMSHWKMVYNPYLNVTRVELVFTKNIHILNIWSEFFNYAFITALSFGIVLITSVIMIIGLRRSSRFRQAIAAKGKSSNHGDGLDVSVDGRKEKENPVVDENKPIDRNGAAQRAHEKYNDDDTSGAKSTVSNSQRKSNSNAGVMSSNNIRLTKMVMISAALTCSANLLSPMLSVWLLVNLELSPFGRFYRLFNLLILGIQTVFLLTMGANVFLYYKYNTRFRETLLQMFRGQKLTNKK